LTNFEEGERKRNSMR